MGDGLYAIIPVKSLARTKSRLSRLLTLDERKRLNLLVLKEVIKTMQESRVLEGLIAVSPDPRVLQLCRDYGVICIREERDEGVNRAVAKGVRRCMQEGASSSLVIPSDLPCITVDDFKKISDLARDELTVALSPSMRLDGTNMLLRRPPNLIKTHYDENSFQSHINEAKRAGAKLILYLSRTVMLDLDTEADLALFLEEPSSSPPYTYLTSLTKRKGMMLGGKPQALRSRYFGVDLTVQMNV